jgi:uncharacterized membrane protein (DUF485 family)
MVEAIVATLAMFATWCLFAVLASFLPDLMLASVRELTKPRRNRVSVI